MINKNLENLLSIANKQDKIIIGLMSGTSLDGLDIVLCKFNGSGIHTKLTVLAFETIAYNNFLKEQVKEVFSKKEVNLQKMCLLNEWLGIQHATMINNFLKARNIDNTTVDIIASHGQTIYHAPKSLHGLHNFLNGTLQIADGDHIAVNTGIITICDFRQKHIAAGGEGAPLAVYGDYLLFSKKDEDRIMLNIGGIANFTFLPGSLNATEIFSTDTGTGNTLMDAYTQLNFEGKYFDENSTIALQGNIDEKLLEALKDNTFFNEPYPKTTGPELFNIDYLKAAQQKSNTTHLSVVNVMATLNKFTADTIVDALNKTMQQKKYCIYASGGGIYNILLMQHLQQQLPNATFKNINDLMVHPDAKEAVLFATLANEAIAGGNTFFGNAANKMPTISMGKICFPN